MVAVKATFPSTELSTKVKPCSKTITTTITIHLQNYTTQVTTSNIHSRVLDLNLTTKALIEIHCWNRPNQLIRPIQSLQTIGLSKTIIIRELLVADSHKGTLLTPDWMCVCQLTNKTTELLDQWPSQSFKRTIILKGLLTLPNWQSKSKTIATKGPTREHSTAKAARKANQAINKPAVVKVVKGAEAPNRIGGYRNPG